MGIGSAIGDKFDAVMDWVMDGHPVWAVTKLTGLVLGATALLISPFVYAGHHNEAALKDRMEELDSKPTMVFNSVAGCKARGIDQKTCEASREEALDVASSLGTRLAYGSFNDCAAVHGDCRVHHYTTVTMAGKVPIVTPHTEYLPQFVGWQAATHDLKEAAPLYASARGGGFGVRNDGKILSFAR